jgi:chromosome segregation ATPase
LPPSHSVRHFSAVHNKNETRAFHELQTEISSLKRERAQLIENIALHDVVIDGLNRQLISSRGNEAALSRQVKEAQNNKNEGRLSFRELQDLQRQLEDTRNGMPQPINDGMIRFSEVK